MPLPSHYTMLGVIGQGQNSEVCKGYDSVLEWDVAIKLLNVRSGDAGELRREFISRARFLAGTQIPFFIKVFQIYMDSEYPVMVMELANSNLTSALNCNNPVANILGCLKALDGIHQAGFQHGNINPRNILFFENDVIKFSDPSVMSETMRSIPSSAKYLVPELAARDRWLETKLSGTKVDIYQLGFSILETIGGDGFLEHFPGAKLKEVDQEQFWWNWHAGPESFELIIESVVPRKFMRVRELLKKMLEKDPSKRASSSGELFEWFERNRSLTENQEGCLAPNESTTSRNDWFQFCSALIRNKKFIAIFVGLCFLASLLFIVFPFLFFNRKSIDASTSQTMVNDSSNSLQFTNDLTTVTKPDAGTKLQKLTIESSPLKANIIVNGKSTGKFTPSTIDLDRQNNDISLEIRGLNKINFSHNLVLKNGNYLSESRVFKEFNLKPSVRVIDIKEFKLDFVEINPSLFETGVFQMGSTQDEQDEAIKNNKSEELLIRSEFLHKVKLTKFFSISTMVVSRRLFKEFLKDSSYQMESQMFLLQKEENDELPAVNISWKDANEFCKWLTKCSPPHLGIFTLPTEAEWEFACRCGSRSPFSFDDKESDFRYFANFNDGFSLNRKVPFGIMKPGQLRPNPWGLFDMHGNVWQFCSDRFGDFNKEYESDPTGPSQGSSHVIRGGSFAVNKFMGRSASRNKMDDFVLSDETTGFRLVLRPNSE